MKQPSLFEQRETIASPICVYQKPCPRKGQAELGPPVDLGSCINRSILCLKCGAHGAQSTRVGSLKD